MRAGKRLAVVLIAMVSVACASSAKKPATDPEMDPKHQYQKGVISLRYGLTDEAVRYARLAIGLDPAYALAYNLLGTALFNLGDFVEAAAAYEKAAGLDPGSAEFQTNLGLALSETGASDEAEAAFRKAHEIDGSAAFYLGRLLYDGKRFEEALDFAQKAILKDSRSAAAYNLKGVILNELRRYPEAAGSFQAGLVLAPDDVSLRINLGIAYINAQEPEKARAVLEKALPLIKDTVLKARIEEYLKKLKDS